MSSVYETKNEMELRYCPLHSIELYLARIPIVNCICRQNGNRQGRQSENTTGMSLALRI